MFEGLTAARAQFRDIGLGAEVLLKRLGQSEPLAEHTLGAALAHFRNQGLSMGVVLLMDCAAAFANIPLKVLGPGCSMLPRRRSGPRGGNFPTARSPW